ncbi:hypothetical protein [Frateuria sp. Soil773]|uniref:hypothetical protein n=1 Tax=Frateuria sp. Soil773 TaxID=1736407 RepID=UPI0012FCB32F|nr:hypothetical protein [Frateuria sp. Soil773]
MNELTLGLALIAVGLMSPWILLCVWVWRHRVQPKAPTNVDEASLLTLFDEILAKDRVALYQAGFQVGLKEPERVDVAALFASVRRRFHIEDEMDAVDPAYLEGQRAGEAERVAAKPYRPILGEMMPRAPDFHTDTRMSEQVVQDFLKTQDMSLAVRRALASCRRRGWPGAAQAGPQAESVLMASLSNRSQNSR